MLYTEHRMLKTSNHNDIKADVLVVFNVNDISLFPRDAGFLTQGATYSHLTCSDTRSAVQTCFRKIAPICSLFNI